jgi:hypothetical protein
MWIGIRAKEMEATSAQQGLRSPINLTVRARWHPELQPGRYLRTADRLLLIDAVRDIDGKRADAIMSCTEFIGEIVTYQTRSVRVFLSASSPVVGQRGGKNDYRMQAEFALVESGRVQPGESFVLGVETYTITSIIDDGDDGITRKAWVTT